MKKYFLSTIACITAVLIINNNSLANKYSVNQYPESDTKTNVIINDVRLSDEEVYSLEQRYHIKVFDGAYWYDPVCGAWGMQGGPCIGLGQPGLKLGGSLKENASNGNTGVFVNGRQLNIWDVLTLQTFMLVLPGRYWALASGDYGYAGSPIAIGNFRVNALNSGGSASNTIYGKFGTLSEVAWTGNTIGGQDPYFR